LELWNVPNRTTQLQRLKAVDRLKDLIREHGKWVDPAPALAIVPNSVPYIADSAEGRKENGRGCEPASAQITLSESTTALFAAVAQLATAVRHAIQISIWKPADIPQ
jgi:hypothetical protein